MDFFPFPKIVARPGPLPGGPWVATEKVHGANFVVGIDGPFTYFGKRRAWLHPDEPFFGWQLVRAYVGDGVRAVAHDLGVTQLFAYGELCGGAYPHPEVPPAPGLAPVQTGVWYCPDIHWVLFDLLMVREGHPEWVDWSTMVKVAARHGLFTSPVLGRGNRTILEQLPVEFPSRVHQHFGLPPIEGNLAEGLVLRTERGGAFRVLFKKKHPSFDEARFGEAEAWAPPYLGVAELSYWANRLVNPARISSARSKVGTGVQEIAEEVALDVAIDIDTTFPDGWSALGAEGQERVLSETRARAVMLASG